MKLVRLLAEELGYGFRRIGSASRKTWPVVKINDFEISLKYEGQYKKDFTNNSGIINFRYNF